MPTALTPGQRAYETYVTARHGYAVLRPWPRLPQARRTAWEAAAQAAIVHHEEDVQRRASVDMVHVQQRGPAHDA